MHSRRYYPDVQDLGPQLFDNGIQSECAISRWNQVRRLSSDDHWNAHVGLLPVYFSSEGIVAVFLIDQRVSSGLTHCL